MCEMCVVIPVLPHRALEKLEYSVRLFRPRGVMVKGYTNSRGR